MFGTGVMEDPGLVEDVASEATLNETESNALIMLEGDGKNGTVDNSNHDPNLDKQNNDNKPNNEKSNSEKHTADKERRTRVLTTKGKDYQKNTWFQKRKSCHNRLLRQLTLVTQCLESSSIDMVNMETSNLDKLLSELVDINLKYLELEDEEHLQEQCHEWIGQVDETVFEMKTKVCTWLREQDSRSQKSSRSSGSRRSGRSSKRSCANDVSQRAGRSCDSVRSKDSHKTSSSNHSRKSNRSNQSAGSSSDSIRNKAHLVGLKTEMEELKANWDSSLERKTREFQQAEEAQMQDRLAQLKNEITVTAAKQVVFEDEENTDVKRRTNGSCHTQVTMNISKPPVPPQVNTQHKRKVRKQRSKKYVEDKSVETPAVESAATELSKAVIDMMVQSSAPDVTLDDFSGNILEFDYFKANFKEMVENKVKDQRGRLTRLLQYTSGDAKDLIKGCVHESSDRCFLRAMELLNKEYGDPHATTCAYLNELRSWPPIRSNDAKAYKGFYRFLLKCQSFKNEERLTELDSTDMIRTMLSRFATPVQEAWNKAACKIRDTQKREAVFDDLVLFVDYQSRLLNNPAYSRDAFGLAKNVSNGSNSTTYKTYATGVNEAGGNPETKKDPCFWCNDVNHGLETCPGFMTKTLSERRKIIFQNRLCFACLKPTSEIHKAETCNQKQHCAACSETHPTCLHVFSVSGCRPEGGRVTGLPVIPVILYHRDDPSTQVQVYALMDECSTGTFVKESLLQSFPSLPQRTEDVGVKTVIGMENSYRTAVEGFVVEAIPAFKEKYKQKPIELPTCFAQKEIPVDSAEIPCREAVRQWKHLAGIEDFLLTRDDHIPVGLLIGGNCTKTQEPHEVILSEEDGPYANRSRLGWCIVGPLMFSELNTRKCNLVGVRVPAEDITTNTQSSHHFAICNTIKQCSIENQLREMYMHDFNEPHPEKKGLSVEDTDFLTRMKEGVVKQDSGHYCLPLPFRNPGVIFPNNRAQAVSRAGTLKKKMLKDKGFQAEYNIFVQNMLNMGFARKVPDIERNDPNVWYIPHHAVFHPTKKKIRVVFDCAAKYQGRCLNDELLQGPDLANLLVGVLIRFRKEPIAVQADITSMFYQVRVPSYQQKFLRFLYWPDGDVSKGLEEFQMCVHLFGARSSTSCCLHALHQAAVNKNNNSSDEARQAILDSFYMDDLLKSFPTDEVALQQVKEITSLCGDAGYYLSKCVSISETVMEGVPLEKKAESMLKRKDFGANPHVERALGVAWYIVNDSFGFIICMSDTPLIRRGMLSTITSVFDPQGLAGPFLLKGRKIMQEVTGETKSWDDSVSDEHSAAWRRWRTELLDLNELVVNRCYKPVGFGEATHSSLHCFSDASDIGYGQATYLRQENERGDVAVSLVLGKSRVAPLKVTTIPRLELVAATVSAKVSALVKEEIKIDNFRSVLLY